MDFVTFFQVSRRDGLCERLSRVPPKIATIPPPEVSKAIGPLPLVHVRQPSFFSLN